MKKDELAYRISVYENQTSAPIGNVFFCKRLVDHYTKNQLKTVLVCLENGYEFFGNFAFDCCVRKKLECHTLYGNSFEYYYFPVYRDGVIGTGVRV